MKAITRNSEIARSSYLVVLLGALGVFALITAVLIAWPALAYLGSKMM